MQNRTQGRVLAAGALLGLVTLGTNLHADSVIEIDDALATKVEQDLRLKASSDGHNFTSVTVQAKGGVLRLEGIIKGLDERRVVNDVLKGIDGLHMDQVDDHLYQRYEPPKR